MGKGIPKKGTFACLLSQQQHFVFCFPLSQLQELFSLEECVVIVHIFLQPCISSPRWDFTYLSQNGYALFFVDRCLFLEFCHFFKYFLSSFCSGYQKKVVVASCAVELLPVRELFIKRCFFSHSHAIHLIIINMTPFTSTDSTG